MIEVRPFARLIFETTTWLLTLENSVALEGFLVEQVFSIDISLTFHGNVKHLKCGTLPEIIAGVDKLVDSAVEPTFLCELTIT